ncbi:cytochrome P450 4V2-like [Haemaphysalis longicornis]
MPSIRSFVYCLLPHWASPWASVLASFVVIAVLSRRWLRSWILLRSIPGPGTDWLPPWSLLNLYWKHGKALWSHDCTTAFLLFLKHNSEIYEGRTFKFYLGMTPIVMLHTPEAVEVLLTSKKNLKKPFMYLFLDSWFGKKNLLTSEGEEWKVKARMLKAGLNVEYLESFMDIFNKNSKIFVERIEAGTRDSQQRGRDCIELVESCVMDNIFRALLGEELELQRGKNQDYIGGFHTMTWLAVARLLRPWAWFEPLYYLTPDGKTWKNTIRKLEAVHMAAIEKRALAVKQQLADEGEICDTGGNHTPLSYSIKVPLQRHFQDPSYTIQEVLEDAQSLMFAAGGTSTIAISWAIYLLGLHPGKQAKLQKELDDAFGPGVEREYTSADLAKLPYMDASFKEALRLFPPVPAFGRELKEDLVLDGHTVPAGTTCGVSAYSLHRNKKLYPDPEKYLPERFLENNIEKMHPFAFVAFSGGVRPCPGKKLAYAQAKVLMAAIFSKYNVESTEPLEKLSLGIEITLRVKEGLNVKFHKRSL